MNMRPDIPGANVAVDVLITRWKTGSGGAILEREGRPLLEMLSLRRADGAWAVPGALKGDATGQLRNILRKAFGMGNMLLPRDLREEIEVVQRELMSHAKPFYHVRSLASTHYASAVTL
jgi:hypothetical protein